MNAIPVTGWLIDGVLPGGESELHPSEADAKDAATARWRSENWPANKATEVGPGVYSVTLAHIPPPRLEWFPSNDVAGTEVLYAQGKATNVRVRRIRYTVTAAADV